VCEQEFVGGTFAHRCLRGVIRGRTIELEQEPPLPDGTQVEGELRPLTAERYNLQEETAYAL